MSVPVTTITQKVGCPDHDTVVRFIEHRLGPYESAQFEAHMSACPSCRQLVSSLIPDEEPTPPSELRLGRFVLIEQIGAGGMGRVYAAYDPTLDRKIALKILREGVATTTEEHELRARLIREAQAIAKLTHPNVISVYEAGLHDETLYIALEYIDGGTLKDWTRQPHPTDEILEVFTKAGRGLAAAHHAGLVHRDFKPANVLMGRDGRVLVADFGLVVGLRAESTTTRSLRHGTWSPDERLTAFGHVMGTPRYMAPEQMCGEAVDARADQFSFCVALYQALFDQYPFAGDDLTTLGAHIVNGEVRAPPARAGVSARLTQAVLRGLRPQPAERHASMDALLAELAPLRPRRRTALLGGALAVVLAVASTWMLSRGPSQADQAAVAAMVEQARNAAGRHSYLIPPTDAPDVTTAYAAIRRLESMSGEGEGLGSEAAARLREEFGAALIDLGDEYWDKERGHDYALDFYVAALIFDPTNEHARARAGVTPGELLGLRERAESEGFTPAERDAAERLAILARASPDETSAAIEQARRQRRDTFAGRCEAPPKAPSPSPAVVGAQGPPPTSDADSDVSDPPVSADAPSLAASVEDSPRSPKRAQALTKSARAALNAGDLTRAERLFRRALEQAPRSAAAHAGLGEVAFERRQWTKAKTETTRAVELSPRHAGYRLLLGDIHRKLHHYADARHEYEEAKALGSRKATARLESLAKLVGD